MDSEKSTLFGVKKRIDYLIIGEFFLQINNFSAVQLCKIYVPDIFDVDNTFQVTKYWKSDRIELLVGNVRAIDP